MARQSHASSDGQAATSAASCGAVQLSQFLTSPPKPHPSSNLPYAGTHCSPCLFTNPAYRGLLPTAYLPASWSTRTLTPQSDRARRPCALGSSQKILPQQRRTHRTTTPNWKSMSATQTTSESITTERSEHDADQSPCQTSTIDSIRN